MAKHPTPKPYTPRNPEKYTGKYPIVSRSAWEWDFMVYCDNNPDILEWASEPHEIPYRDPITGKQKIYIPDFLVTLINQRREIVKKLIEIKPMHEQLSEFARNTKDAALQARNRAKWGAAASWCQRRGISFEVMNESNLYDGHDKKKGRVNPVREYAPAQSMPRPKVLSKKAKHIKLTPGQKVTANMRKLRAKVAKVKKTQRIKRV